MTHADSPVLATVQNRVGYLTLNRPAKLNTLNLVMIGLLHSQLRAWDEDPNVLVVVLSAAGEKAFCAGGDIRALYDSYLSGDGQYVRFFEDEYALDQYIHGYRKPVLALMEGLVLGGGLGLVQGAALRVITERARLGMPEVAIGYFPDVGASYFLPRLPGELGTYLAVTGRQVLAGDALYAGLADVCIPHERLADLRQQLDTYRWGVDPAADLLSLVTPLSCDPGPSALKELRPAIDDYFALPDMLAIRDALLAVTQAELHAWAQDTVALIDARSPLAMSVTLELMRWGRNRSLAECFAMELFLDRQWFADGDIMEGIRALIIEKGSPPIWNPPSLHATSAAQIHSLFAGFGQPLGDT